METVSTVYVKRYETDDRHYPERDEFMRVTDTTVGGEPARIVEYWTGETNQPPMPTSFTQVIEDGTAELDAAIDMEGWVKAW
jgi:hypothetical protein